MIQGAPFAQVKDMVMDESGVTEELDELKEFAETDNDEAKTKAENIKVRISADKMKAYISLRRSQQEFTVSDVEAALRASGVVYGYNEDNIRRMIDQEGYLEPLPVAEGLPAVESVPGSFEYFFEMPEDSKPVILEDGSVDYMNVNAFVMVEEGDVIAKYTPAVQGSNGCNVLGVPIVVKRVAELPPLRGQGFSRSEDGQTYTATVTGKIQEDKGRIIISNVYEVRGDASVATGNIDFRGDVIIHGAVRDGIVIKATGSITVSDIVEGAQIEAGGDIVLKKGLLGNSKAKIKCKGNLTAKFIEFCYVDVEGDIHAESFMESEIYCYGHIYMEGRKGKIIGGTTIAIEGIDANIIGNSAEVPTFIRAGVDAELKYQLITIKKKIEATKSSLERVEQGLEIISRIEATGVGDPEENKSNRMQLMRVKIRDSSILSMDKLEQDRLETLITNGQGVEIVVQDTIFGGTNIKIGDQLMKIKSKDVRCIYSEGDDGIQILRM